MTLILQFSHSLATTRERSRCCQFCALAPHYSKRIVENKSLVGFVW